MDIREEIRRAVKDAGDQQSLARKLGVAPSYLSDVLNCRKEPGEAILEPLGFERVVTYRRKRASNQ